MPRYFFHVHDSQPAPDVEGTVLPDAQAARTEAVAMAARMLMDSPETFWNDGRWSVEVQDDAGRTLFMVDFAARTID